MFELVGHQSRIKSDEGKEPRLVLTAVREHMSGEYWTHETLMEIGERYGVEVVRRFRRLERNGIGEVVCDVQQCGACRSDLSTHSSVP